MNFNFPTSEKLKSKKVIEMLFEEGKTGVKFPVKIFYLPSENTKITQAGFAVSKRNFKKAVDRNRIKRQLREAYRLHKHLLTSHNEQPFTLFFLYLSKEKLPYQKIEQSIISLLKKIDL